MKHRFFPAMIVLMLASIACGLPGPQTPPTVAPLPPTPVFLASPIPPPTAAQTAASFTGTWKGPDPDDGSTMTLTLVQTGNTLEGRYSDTYSGNITPPGYAGTVTGSVLSATAAQVTMNLGRHDGQNLLLQTNISLSDQNTVQVTITSQSGVGLWVLTRQ